MKQETIQIQYHPKPVRDTTAWFLPGNDPREWLLEIVLWGIPQMSLRLFLVPQSKTIRAPRGLLVITDQALRPQRGLPYGQLASRLFLPVEASLEPEISQKELAQLLLTPYVWIWHPEAGLIACENRDEYRVSDLMKGGIDKETNWDSAVPGIAVAHQLRSISLAHPPDLHSLFQQEKQEIGTDSNSLDKLPKDPKESVFDHLPSPLKLPRKLFARGILSIARHVPTRTTGAPNWINHLENWAGKQLRAAFNPDKSKRNREIQRLLNLLGSDPDKGLKYALPMGGNAGHRGVASSGDSLTSRDMNIDFTKLGAGGPADFWDIPYETQIVLMNRYRELANREIHLGRYRRAAYIYAHLLGDYAAAAQTLKTGRQWREAAVLYKDKLHQQRAAADCLLEGGLWAEAISEYEDLKEFEKAGDLHRKLEQETEAIDAYHQAAHQFHQQHEHTEAARILEQKIHSTDEAITELESGWPHSKQARHCLDQVFQLFNQHGLHQRALEKIDELSETKLTLPQRLPLVQFLTETRNKYPHPSVSEHAEEHARVLIANSLEHADLKQEKELLTQLGKLVPADILLQRDASRYLKQKRASPPARRSRRGSAIKLIRTIELSKQIDWQTAVALGETIYAAGIDKLNSKMVLERCLWSGVTDSAQLSWSLNPGEANDFPILMIPKCTSPDHQLFIRVLTARDHFQNQHFPQNDLFAPKATAGDFNGLPHIILGATAGSLDGISCNLAIQKDLFLTSTYNRQGHLLSSHSTPIPEGLNLSNSSIQFPIPCLERRNKLFFALGPHLGIIDSQGAHIEEFHRPIQSMAASYPNTQIRIAVSFDQGGNVIWDGLDSNSICSFGDGIDHPYAAFQRNGNLIVAGKNDIEIYMTQRRRLELSKRLALPEPETVALLTENQGSLFALLSRSGQLSIYLADT